MVFEIIKFKAKELSHQLIAWRRHLHQHPELSFQEYETSAYIKAILDGWGIKYEVCANTGIVALLEGSGVATQDANCVALRADIDALPIFEQNTHDYASKNPGVMHACGHDVHTTCLLGAVNILNEIRDKWAGTIKILFQPGEEKSPGGASIMIREGALQNPKPDYIIGQHVMPQLEVGKVGFRPGIYMASADEIYIDIHGKGGHAATPENLIDPVVIASHIIIALQQLISRNASPKIPSVLSFGKIEALGATNIIPNSVHIEGTFRTMNETWRARAKEKIITMTKLMAEAMGARAEVRFNPGYPYLENNPFLTEHAKEWAIAYLGPENVVDLEMWMASEDFAFYTHETAGCFYRLGVKNEAKGITSLVHTPTFDIDETALEIGAGLMAWIAYKALQLNKH